MPEPVATDQPKQIRMPIAWPLGLISMVIGAWFVITSISLRGPKVEPLGMAFGLIVVVGGYLFGVRPGVQLSPQGITIRNPLRTTVVPWAKVTEVKVADVLIIVDDTEHKTRAYSVSGTMRSLARVEKAVDEVEAYRVKAVEAGTSAGTIERVITWPVRVALALVVLAVAVAALKVFTGVL